MMSTRRFWLLASLFISELSIKGHAAPAGFDDSERLTTREDDLLGKRDDPQFAVGQPIDGTGKGAPIYGM